MQRLTTAAMALGLMLAGFAARADNPPPKIGAPTDESGPLVDSGGPGPVAAAEMAASDFGGEGLQRQIEIVHGDTLNKSDVAAAIARRCFDVEGVAAITDFPGTPIAFAVQALAKGKNRTAATTATAAESKARWDDYVKLRDIPAAEALKPANVALCGD